MKKIYKNHEIDVRREKCLAGYSLLYYTVYRLEDGYECVCDFEDSKESVNNKIKQMQNLIDKEIEKEDPWDYKARYEN